MAFRPNKGQGHAKNTILSINRKVLAFLDTRENKKTYTGDDRCIHQIS